MTLTIATFVLGLVLLAGGGELLIRSATRLATDLGVSRLFIGLTVVAFGTSAPEVVVSLVAALRGSGELALGNVVGSNILNVLLILGLSALIVPLSVSAQLVRFDVPVLIGASALCLVLALDGSLGRAEGLLLVALLAAHLVASYRRGVEAGRADAATAAARVPVAPPGLPRAPVPSRNRATNVVLLVASMALLVLGSRWLVSAATAVALHLGLSELVVGLTVVALGTSVPEVVTSVVAALRGERDIAVGNVVGSNLFNLLGVLGLSATLAPGGVTVAPAALAFDVPVMLAAAVLCLPIFFTHMTVFRWEGGLLLGYFVLYTTYTLLDATQHRVLEDFTSLVLWVIWPATGLTLAAATTVNLLRRDRAARPGTSRPE